MTRRRREGAMRHEPCAPILRPGACGQGCASALLDAETQFPLSGTACPERSEGERGTGGEDASRRDPWRRFCAVGAENEPEGGASHARPGLEASDEPGDRRPATLPQVRIDARAQRLRLHVGMVVEHEVDRKSTRLNS